MSDRGQVLAATVFGAVAGGVFGFLYLTDRGRRVREQLEPLLDTVIDELDDARGTVDRVRGATGRGRRGPKDRLRPTA